MSERIRVSEFEKLTGHKKGGYCTCDGAGSCTYCTLFVCSICGGAEGDLPTHCPGVKLTEEQRQNIVDVKLDFINGKWREK